jgi:RimJ/RimL family protein N-acetyltransferase
MEWTGSPSLEGPRLLLTPLQFSNIRTHFRWNNDPALHQLESEQPFVRESYGAFARRFTQLSHNDLVHGYDFEIHLRGSRDAQHAPHLIGIGYLTELDVLHQRALLGLTIAERTARGKGYGREALELLLHFGFATLGLHRLMAHTLANNTPWKHLLTTAGFHREGCLRDHVYRQERYWDKEFYALLDTEYHACQSRAA